MAFLSRLSTSIPRSASQPFTWASELGLESPVSCWAWVVALALNSASQRTAWAASRWSTMMPLSLISWSKRYSSISLSGMG